VVPGDRGSSASRAFPPIVHALIGHSARWRSSQCFSPSVCGHALSASRCVLRLRRGHSSRLPEGLRMNNDFVRRFFNADEPEQMTPRVVTSKSDEGVMGTGGGGRDQPEPADQVYDEIGEQVSAILSAAKQAAHQLRESARQDAERIRKEAEDRATASLERAGRDAARRRTEGDHVRAEAEAYSKSTREAADRDAAEMRRTIGEEAEKLRTEAMHEASAIRHAAKQKSYELRTEALDRQKALIAEAGRSEARLQQLLDVFRAMTSQLEDLLELEPGGRWGKMQGVDAASVGELDEALRPHRLRDPSA
jgi:hypothetical protein